MNEVLINFQKKPTIVLHSERAVGNYIANSKNIFEGYDIEKTEDARYSWGVEYGKDNHDSSYIYYGEKTYENIANTRSNECSIRLLDFDSSDLTYGVMCFSNCRNILAAFHLNITRYHFESAIFPR